MILGTRDQLIEREPLIAYAEEQAIDLVLTPGDHFFHGRGKRIGDLVGQGLEDG
jgi:alpha/beta superfamily hydrolase